LEAFAAGCSASCTRKCCWQFLQTVEYAPRGSGWEYPQRGQETWTVSLVEAGMASD
jgi:hypothetical protein